MNIKSPTSLIKKLPVPTGRFALLLHKGDIDSGISPNSFIWMGKTKYGKTFSETLPAEEYMGRSFSDIQTMAGKCIDRLYEKIEASEKDGAQA